MNRDDESNAYLTAKVKRLVREERDLKQAVAKFSALGDEAIPILCSLVEAESIFGKRRRWALVGLVVSCIAMNFLLMLFLPRGTRDIYQVLLQLLRGAGTLGLLLSIPYGWRATRLLTALDDARLVGRLLDSLFSHSRDGSLTEAVRRTLTRLLPRLQVSDASQLLPRHITALNRDLEICHSWNWASNVGIEGKDVSYGLAVFQALEQFGDETSIPVVERVLKATKNARIRQAAEDCLPYLRQHATMGRNTLLRAADPVVSDLLLPVNRGAVSDPTVLLRPLSSGDDS